MDITYTFLYYVLLNQFYDLAKQSLYNWEGHSAEVKLVFQREI